MTIRFYYVNVTEHNLLDHAIKRCKKVPSKDVTYSAVKKVYD